MRSETLETIKQKNGLIDQIKEVDFWMLTMTVARTHGGRVTADEVVLPVTAGGVLPCGASGRWEAV